jgi:hypothetical protein
MELVQGPRREIWYRLPNDFVMCRLQWFPVNYAQHTLCRANIHKCPRPAYFYFLHPSLHSLHPSLHSLIRRHIHRPAHPHIKDQSANTSTPRFRISSTTPRDPLAHTLKKKATSESLPPACMCLNPSLGAQATVARVIWSHTTAASSRCQVPTHRARVRIGVGVSILR